MTKKELKTLLNKVEERVWKDMEMLGKKDPSYNNLNCFCLCMSYISGVLNEMILDDTLNLEKKFSGLYDKNGKPINEGDWVKTKSGRVCIVHFKSTPCFHGWDMTPVGEDKIPGNCTDKKAPSKYDLWDSQNLEIYEP